VGEVKLDRDGLKKSKRKDTQMKKIWFGNIPDIFGYGISCLGNSKKEVMDTMKKEYKQWKAGRAKHGFGDESTNFETSYEYYGGWVEQVEIGKGYYEGLRG
jgi:hypothetical protein